MRDEEARDEALLERLKSGKATAFEELVRSFGGEMRAAAVRLLMNDADADDAIQDAFLSAFQAVGSFEGRSRIGTWLHRIAINASLMKLRTKGRRPETGLEDLLPEFLENGAFATPQIPWEEPADEPAIRRELYQQVHAHIDQLPDNYRVPLLLRDIEGLRNKEIAEVLGLSMNTVKIRVHRARQALRSLLGRHAAELS